MTTDNSNLPPEPPEPKVPLMECPCCMRSMCGDELPVLGVAPRAQLSVRAYGVLANARIKSIAEVARMSNSEILQLRGAGKKVLSEVIRVVDALGLSQYRQDWQDWKHAMYLYQEAKVSRSPSDHRQ